MYPTIAMLGLMVFMWGAAVWATHGDEDREPASKPVAELYDKAA